MSESAPRINPSDVFPRRNLPGAAEQWGRAVENRTRELEKNAVAVNQSLHGANRGTAAQLASISDQLKMIPRVQATQEIDPNAFAGESTYLYYPVPIEVSEFANRVSAVVTVDVSGASEPFYGFLEAAYGGDIHPVGRSFGGTEGPDLKYSSRTTAVVDFGDISAYMWGLWVALGGNGQQVTLDTTALSISSWVPGGSSSEPLSLEEE